MKGSKSEKNQNEPDFKAQKFEAQKDEILLPYTLEVLGVLRKIEKEIRDQYQNCKNSMDLKSLDPRQDIEIIIDIDKSDCFWELLDKVYECSYIEEISQMDNSEKALEIRIIILILVRILGYDGELLWNDIYENVNKVVSQNNSIIIEQPFYRFKYYNDHKTGLVIKDYIVIPRDFVAAYFGYDTGIEGLNLLMNGGFLLPPDRSAYISVSGEAGIGKTALVVRLITAFFQNYRFKNVPPPPPEKERDKKLKKGDAELLYIHYILMEQHEKNIIRLIKECQLIDTKQSNVISVLGRKNKEDSLTEADIRKIIDFGDEKTDILSPMKLIETIETIENPQDGKNKGKRKIIVIDSVNAIQEMDINRTEWRELFQSIKAVTRNGNTVVFFVVEKNPDKPDFVMEYLSDVVIKLYRDYKEEAFYRVFELVESRFQTTISGKHIFYITKPDSGFIRVYPSTTAMGELLPNRKRVKPVERDDRRNRKEVGIKIEGIKNFFKYSHLYPTKMEPFFLKNCISMFFGERGAHKSAFAKRFALSAFRDERWETTTNYIVEIDYRERESNKPLDELLLIGFWNARPVEKSISVLLYFSENYDEDPEYDIIWETYFGKVIIPGCKAGGNNYIGHISHIVCLYEVKDYTEDIYIYQLDELIRTIESCKAGEDIPGTYYDFINRKNISRIARKTKNDKLDRNKQKRFNPFNTVYKGNFIKDIKIDREKLFTHFIKQEIHIMGFQKNEITAGKIRQLLGEQEKIENVCQYIEKFEGEERIKIESVCLHIKELEENPIIEYYDKIIDEVKEVREKRKDRIELNWRLRRVSKIFTIQKMRSFIDVAFGF